jgi:drug/metabolite transporter (DMT)-like permease
MSRGEAIVSNPTEAARTRSASISLRGLLHLAVVYLVWSSTYLAMRVAVRPGAGFPPFTLGAVRCVLAGILLLAWMGWKGRRARLTRAELRVLAVSGTLLWTTGNGFVLFAEQRVESALAALLLSSTPIWVAMLEASVDRQYPSLLLALSLLLGFSGTALISGPELRSGSGADALSVLALLVGALSWGGGSLYQRRRHIGLDPVVSSGYQQLFGGVGMAILALLSREPLPRPTPAAWAGFAYLLVFGSLLAFTSYLLALRLLPTRIVFTYAYVNPVIAVFLGWLVLGERIGGWTLAGAALVLVGVAGTFRARMQ